MQAEEFLGTKVTKAVVTVPAYFNDAQRQVSHLVRPASCCVSVSGVCVCLESLSLPVLQGGRKRERERENDDEREGRRDE